MLRDWLASSRNAETSSLKSANFSSIACMARRMRGILYPFRYITTLFKIKQWAYIGLHGLRVNSPATRTPPRQPRSGGRPTRRAWPCGPSGRPWSARPSSSPPPRLPLPRTGARPGPSVQGSERRPGSPGVASLLDNAWPPMLPTSKGFQACTRSTRGAPPRTRGG